MKTTAILMVFSFLSHDAMAFETQDQHVASTPYKLELSSKSINRAARVLGFGQIPAWVDFHASLKNADVQFHFNF